VTALAAHGLRVELLGGETIVDDVSLALPPGTALGLVGESGSGKTTTALALLGFARRGLRIAGGTVTVSDRAVVPGKDAGNRLRGRLIAYVPQDPGSALNPSIRDGRQIGEVARAHLPQQDRARAVKAALQRVQLPSNVEFQDRYPHQLSGGQQQRVAIAKALVCEPSVVVMDEPTTGLDVITQARLLEQIRALKSEAGLALVYVSHDLAVVASIVDRVAVMYAGRIVEEGPVTAILNEPAHPYTAGLVASIPDHSAPRRLHSMAGVAPSAHERPPGCAFAPRCPQAIAECVAAEPPISQIQPDRLVRCIRWRNTPRLVLGSPLEPATHASATPLLSFENVTAIHVGRIETTVAVRDVSFAIAAGECLAVVGESGSGKTTLARCIAGLHRPISGQIRLEGSPLAPAAGARSKEDRRCIQLVFQNPTDSLNPRHRIGDSIARPARLLRNLGRDEADAEVAELLEKVRLPAHLADRFPAELSGGERQRVAIARALAAHPNLVICDEITSALDVSVQAAVIELLRDLQAELSLSLLFISHDLGVVATVADRMIVLDRGAVCEQGASATVLTQPHETYTQKLLAAAPTLTRIGD
jgi:peptide/nickel transport system ATP-binding protein